MRIEGNSIGNYSVNYLNNISKNLDEANKVSKRQKTEPPLNIEEKKFFAELYPQNRKEINEYNFYDRDGKTKSASIGSIIDRRA